MDLRDAAVRPTLNALSMRALGPRAHAALDGDALHLHGAVITPEKLIRAGTVVVRGNRIEEVTSAPLPAGSDGVDIETRGLICPGFVDTHNHAAYAAFPRWYRPLRLFRSRFDWRSKTRCGEVVVDRPDPYYEKEVAGPHRKLRNEVPNAVRHLMLFGQVRGILGGATTMVVDADLAPDQDFSLPGFVRETGTWNGRVWGVLDVGCVQNHDEIRAELESDRACLLAHVGEGIDEFSHTEFVRLVDKGLLTRNTALIHAIALLDPDWQLVAERGACIIWSPVSNFRLYGRSIDIGLALGAGIRVALAPDWTITGSSTVLDELAFVRRRYTWIPDETLLAMVTSTAADVMRMPDLGRVRSGALADLLIFASDGETTRAEAARRVVTATHADLRLALVDGTAVYGEPELMALCPSSGEADEQLTVPLPDGRTMLRVLRTGEQRPFAEAVEVITDAFLKYGLTLARLWEPT
jgi:5-methylthioadenosine/S-adenosylhomocysteine deaminase